MHTHSVHLNTNDQMELNISPEILKSVNHIHERVGSTYESFDSSSKKFKFVISLIFLQVSYVVFDLIEAKTLDRTYGIVAGFLMVLFGLSILFVTFQSYLSINVLNKDLLLETLEGVVYISLGSAITFVRYQNHVNDIGTSLM